MGMISDLVIPRDCPSNVGKAAHMIAALKECHGNRVLLKDFQQFRRRLTRSIVECQSNRLARRIAVPSGFAEYSAGPAANGPGHRARRYRGG